MKKVLALAFLVSVVLDSIVCQEELGPLTDCCDMTFSGTTSRTITGSNICIPTHLIDLSSVPPLRLYGEFRVNVGNIDGDVTVEVYLFHDTQLNLDNYCFCKEGDSISVRTKTDSGFVELAGGGLRIRIGDTDTIVRLYGQGFHLINDTFTVSDIRRSSRTPLLISSMVIVAGVTPFPSGFKVCEVFPDEDGATYIDNTHFQVLTLTGFCESFGFGWLNVGGLQLGPETPENEIYVIVVSSLPCENITTGDEDFITPRITIVNDVAETVTPSPTPNTTPSSATDDNGLSGGVIAGIIVAVVIFVVVMTIAIILAIVIFRKWNPIESKRGRQSSTPTFITEEGRHEGPAEPPGIPELEVEQEELIKDDNRSPVTDGRTIYVCDNAMHDKNREYMKKLLAKEEKDATVEESEPSIATVRRENCVRVYIIFQESMEWLKAHCHQVWEFVRDFQVRPLPSNLLSKVVLIRVYETNDRVAEFIEGPLLVVNFHKEKWLNQPEECVSLIGSKVHIHKQISNDIDGNSSQGCSPPSDRVLTPTNPPPEYSQPHPQEVHSEVPNGGSADLVVAFKEFNKELKAIRKVTEKVAKNTGRAADNTEGLVETMGEARDLAAFTGNEMQDKMVDEEVPDES